MYRSIYLPRTTRALVAVGTFALLLAWNEYLYALPPVVILFALGRYLIVGLTGGSVSSNSTIRSYR